jgi:ferrochelatase
MLFGGVSPINEQTRALLAALAGELGAHLPGLAIYWGNRFWPPTLAEAVEQMTEDGIRAALVFVTSAFGSYSTCRAYMEDIDRARAAVGPAAPEIYKLRLYYNHPGFIEPMAQRISEALAQLPSERRAAARLVFAAHSLPIELAERSPYCRQLHEACALAAERAGRSQWDLAYQSRSPHSTAQWLEPDVAQHVRSLAQQERPEDIVVAPIGFLQENIEVLYELDVRLAELCAHQGINLIRTAPIGPHPRFVQMIRELVLERMDPDAPRLALGQAGPWPDSCPADCCLPRS